MLRLSMYRLPYLSLSSTSSGSAVLINKWKRIKKKEGSAASGWYSKQSSCQNGGPPPPCSKRGNWPMSALHSAAQHCIGTTDGCSRRSLNAPLSAANPDAFPLFKFFKKKKKSPFFFFYCCVNSSFLSLSLSSRNLFLIFFCVCGFSFAWSTWSSMTLHRLPTSEVLRHIVFSHGLLSFIIC